MSFYIFVYFDLYSPIGDALLLGTLQRRLLTSRAVLFTYHDASLSFVEYFNGKEVLFSKCLPEEALVANKTLDFSIVAVPSSFALEAGIEISRLRQGLHTFQLGEVLTLQQNTASADCGAKETIKLVIESVTENEILCTPQGKGEITLGCPIFNDQGELVAMVVRQNRPGGEDGGRGALRAMRVDALLDRLRKRSQIDDALGGAAERLHDGGDDPHGDGGAVSRRRRVGPLTPVRAAALAVVVAAAAAMILWDVARMRARALAR